MRDALFDIWGGGGLEFLLLANFFFTSERKQSFFFGDQRPTIFFLCFVEEFFCRMLSLLRLCTLPFGFFLVNIFFINFDNKLLLFSHIFNKLFFQNFVAINYFFYFFLAPPPQISNGASLTVCECRDRHRQVLHRGKKKTCAAQVKNIPGN